MADIELVINIPEEVKNKIDNATENNYKTYMWWFETELYCAIKNGKSLPKGHGKLVDVNSIPKEDRDIMVKSLLRPGTIAYVGAITLGEYANDLPTIIPATTGNNCNQCIHSHGEDLECDIYGCRFEPKQTAIESRCDRINSLASVLPYTAHREIQELLCEIINLCKTESEEV